MRGELLGAFCERGGNDISHCLELWAYPDTSLNLVVNQYTPEGESEYAFPCAPHQLVNVLKNKSFLSETEDGRVKVEREENTLKAEFISTDGNERWEHSVPVGPFQNALAQVSPDVDKVNE